MFAQDTAVHGLVSRVYAHVSAKNLVWIGNRAKGGRLEDTDMK